MHGAMHGAMYGAMHGRRIAPAPTLALRSPTCVL